jgi:hypothetical protein
MTVLETTLVFLGIPLAVMGVLGLLTLGVGGTRTPRYRPGRPYEFTPVWFLAAPPTGEATTGAPAITAPGRPSRPEVRNLPALGVRRPRVARADAVPATPATHTSGPKGGARGNW